jgi:hypothetical protein
MDQRERYVDDAEVLRLAMQAWQTRIWTAIPGVIKQFPSASGIGQMVADIQPTVNGRVRTTEGTFQSVQMPLLLDCPILWQGGGGVTLTFPIKAGDECLVIFSSRCIDAWWQQGFVAGQAGKPVDGGQPMDPPDLRMHNLSDGFAIVGVRSLPRNYAVATGYAQLRTDDDGAGFSVATDGSHNLTVSTTNGTITLNSNTGNINITTPGGTISLNGVTIDSSGNLTSPATIKAATDVLAGPNEISSIGHTHSEVQFGTDDSGPPVP